MNKDLEFCKSQINIMLSRSKTKVIFPIMTYGLLVQYNQTSQFRFSDGEIKAAYKKSVSKFKDILGHSLHIGGKYYDAYPSRNLPKYGVLSIIENKSYELSVTYRKYAQELISIIPNLVKIHIDSKIGLIPSFGNIEERLTLARDKIKFLKIISQEIEVNSTNFEIFAFAVLKIHLEKFACKIYRDTRTYAHDQGVDLSTNFGAVYQIKKLKLLNQGSADTIFRELQTNFSEDRIKDGNVVLIIDDISTEVRKFLINMKVQLITKDEIINLASILEIEERMKVLRIIFDEFSREYESDI